MGSILVNIQVNSSGNYQVIGSTDGVSYLPIDTKNKIRTSKSNYNINTGKLIIFNKNILYYHSYGISYSQTVKNMNAP